MARVTSKKRLKKEKTKNSVVFFIRERIALFVDKFQVKDRNESSQFSFRVGILN